MGFHRSLIKSGKTDYGDNEDSLCKVEALGYTRCDNGLKMLF